MRDISWLKDIHKIEQEIDDILGETDESYTENEDDSDKNQEEYQINGGKFCLFEKKQIEKNLTISEYKLYNKYIQLYHNDMEELQQLESQSCDFNYNDSNYIDSTDEDKQSMMEREEKIQLYQDILYLLNTISQLREKSEKSENIKHNHQPILKQSVSSVKNPNKLPTFKTIDNTFITEGELNDLCSSFS